MNCDVNYNTVIVRRAVPDDIPALLDLLQQLFALEQDFSFDPEKQKKGLALLIPCEDSCVFVAEQNSEVVGMCSVQTVISTAQGTRSGWVEDVVVSDKCRRNGVGSSLMAAVDSWAKEKGITRLQLLIDSSNDPAYEFYRHHNWHDIHMKPLRKFP